MGKRFFAALAVFITLLTVVTASPVSAVAPDDPDSVTATLNGVDAIDAEWTAPLAGDPVETYTVELLDDTPAVLAAFTFTTADNADFDHTFLGVDPGTYTVRVMADNLDGSSPGLESTPVVVPDVPGAPAAPTVALVGVDGIQVDWVVPASDGDSPITEYQVTLAASAGGPAPATFTLVLPAALTHTFLAVADGTYTATVVATNLVGDGAPSAASSPLTLPAPVVPGPPTAVTATNPTATTMDVGFTAPAVGAPITGYVVTAVPTGGGATVTSPSAGASPITVTGLASGTGYDFTVVASNAVGPGTASAAATASTIGAPNEPTTVTATDATATTMEIGFVAPTDGAPFSGYVVTAVPVGGGATVTSPSVPSSPIVVTGLAPGTTYDFTVVASNGAGPGPASDPPVRATTIGVPTAPTGVTAERTGSTSAEVTFTAPSSNGGAAITNYTVTATPDDASFPTIQASGTASPITVTGHALQNEYTYTVVATNSVADGPSSAPSNVVDFPDVPVVPCCVTASSVTPFNSTVTIEWGAPTDDGGSPIIDYTVTIAGQSQTVAANVFSVTFTGVAVGQHTPTVTASNAGGTSGAATGPEVEVRAFAPFGSEDAFIRQLYRDFLGREADAPGLAYWRGVVADDGSNVADVARSFMFSPEFNPRRSITRLYLAFFDRAPDLGGFDYWAGQINSGQANLDTISQSFVMSPEFVATYGSLSDQDFIRLVYNNVLIRQPDQAGYDFWLAEMANGMTRGQLMTQFSESPEFVNGTRPAVDVIVTYRGMLDREPDSQGFSFWLGQIANNNNAIVSLINGFYNSPEYAGRIIP